LRAASARELGGPRANARYASHHSQGRGADREGLCNGEHGQIPRSWGARNAWRRLAEAPRFEISTTPCPLDATRPIDQPSVRFRQVSEAWGCIFRDTSASRNGPLPHFLPRPLAHGHCLAPCCRRTQKAYLPASPILLPPVAPFRRPVLCPRTTTRTAHHTPRFCSSSQGPAEAGAKRQSTTRDSHVHARYMIIAPLS